MSVYDALSPKKAAHVREQKHYFLKIGVTLSTSIALTEWFLFTTIYSYPQIDLCPNGELQTSNLKPQFDICNKSRSKGPYLLKGHYVVIKRIFPQLSTFKVINQCKKILGSTYQNHNKHENLWSYFHDTPGTQPTYVFRLTSPLWGSHCHRKSQGTGT